MDENSVELIPPLYEGLGWSDGSVVEGDVLGYRRDQRWGLITTNNKKLTKPIFYKVEPFSDLYARVAITKSLSNQLDHGLVNLKGKIVLPCDYFSLEPAGNNIVTGRYEEGETKYGVLNAKFDPIVSLEFDEIIPFGGVMVASENGTWRAFDSRGSEILGVPFERFRRVGGFLEIAKKGSLGLIDIASEQLLFAPNSKQIRYTSASPEAVPPRVWQIYSRKLEKILDIPGDSIFERGGLIVSYLNGVQSVYNDSTELFPDKIFDVKYSNESIVVIEDQGLNLWQAFVGPKKVAEGDSIHFDGHYFYVQKDKLWDVYNKYGRRTNSQSLNAVAVAQQMYVPVNSGGLWGMQDYRGDLLLDYAYDSIGQGIDLTFPVNYIGLWGIMNPFGKWLVQPTYDSLFRMANFYIGYRKGLTTIFSKKGVNLYVTRGNVEEGNNSVSIKRNGKVGLVSEQGVVIFDPIYSRVLHKGDFYLGKRDVGSVVKDGNGEFVLELDAGYEEIFSWDDGFFHIKKNGLHGFVDEMGRLRIANRYDSARTFHEGRAAIKLRGKWGFIDTDERLLVQPHYREASDFYNGLAIVRNEKYGLVDKEGALIFGLEFDNIARTSRGSYILEYANGKVGLADAEGNILLSPSFDDMKDIGDGLIVVGLSGQKGVYGEKGVLLVGFEYDMIKPIGRYLALSSEPLN